MAWRILRAMRNLARAAPRRIFVLGKGLASMASAGSARTQISADEALQRLIDGNARFFHGELWSRPMRQESFAAMAKEQNPYAMVLGCSDSRVPPELIFGAGFGELFVVRIAGNMLSPEVVGSLHYAGVHLATPLFVVLGHEGCGAVGAALDAKFKGAHEASGIQVLIDGLLPGLDGLDTSLERRAQLSRAVEANVRWTCARILETPEAQSGLAEGRTKVVGAIFEPSTGRVRFLR